MPLVVPDVGADKTEEWMNKLMGKTLSEEGSNETMFCKRDLPGECRVIQPGQMVTKDFNPDRLNVQVDNNGTVKNVYHG